MACRGVHFALNGEEYEMLLAEAGNDPRLREIIGEIEQMWNREFLQETDKAWDAIHRCLTGKQAVAGMVDGAAGSYPLNQCILGGRSLYDDDDYIICLIEPEAVKELAVALEPIDENWMKRAYHAHCKDAFPEYGEEGFAYTWEWFSALKSSFKRIALTGRAVIFTADQ